MKKKPATKSKTYKLNDKPYPGMYIDSVLEDTKLSTERVSVAMSPELLDRIIDLLERDDKENA